MNNMNNEKKKKYIDSYTDAFIEKQINVINNEEHGFLYTSCDILIFPVLIHCIDSIEVFNEEQRAIVINLLNKINNE